MKSWVLDHMDGADYIRFVATELHFDLTKEFKVEREMSSADRGIWEKQLECVK